MARTPLFHRLKRALKLASAAEARQLSNAELWERRGQALSRRALLQGTGMLAGAVAAGQSLTACGAKPNEPGVNPSGLDSATRIVVVGAGLAGLTAAYRLAQRGIAARVFDANDRVGGRIFTLRSAQFVSKLELGGEFIDSGHKQIQRLVSELELDLVNLHALTPNLEAERYFIGNQRYTEAQVVEMFRPVARVLQSDFKSLGEPAYASYDAYTPRGRELDRLPLREWLARTAMASPLRTLLDSAYTAEYGLETDQQSYLNLLYLIGQDPDPFLIYGESDEVYTVRQGNDAITQRMATALRDRVELGRRLEAVKQRSDGSLLVTLRSGASTLELVADRLVLAIPFNQLRKVDVRLPISPAKQLSLGKLRYATNSKLMAGTSSRPWLRAGSTGVSFNDAVYQESWDASRGFLGSAGIAAHFSGGKLGVQMGSGSADEQARRFLDRLDAVYPGVRAAYTGQAVRFHWPSAPHFEGSYACYTPGDYTTFVGSEGLVEGNVHFCGEHTSSDAQGYMEGAVESGDRVAEEVRKAMKQPSAG